MLEENAVLGVTEDSHVRYNGSSQRPFNPLWQIVSLDDAPIMTQASVHIGRAVLGFSSFLISTYLLVSMSIPLALLVPAPYSAWIGLLGFSVAMMLYGLYVGTMLEYHLPKFWKKHVTVVQWEKNLSLALKIHRLFGITFWVMPIVFIITWLLVEMQDFTVFGKLVIALLLEFSYFISFPFFTKLRSSYLGLAYDRWGEASLYCARAYAKASQIVSANDPEGALAYLETSMTMTARILKLRGFSDELVLKALTKVEAMKQLAQRSLWTSPWSWQRL